MTDPRREALQAWGRECLEELLGRDIGNNHLEVVSGDASFRRYFRMRLPAQIIQASALPGIADSYILVDAPPEKEDCQRFARVADALREAGLFAPVIHDVDYHLGFMLLQDFGDTLYLPGLLQTQVDNDSQRADRFYAQAIDALLDLQAQGNPDNFPAYDQALLHTEITLFDDWFCQQFLGLQLDTSAWTLLERTYAFLEESALEQTIVCVHRDYHSRNLMVREENENQPPGVVDFQDAVAGPYTYDLVSLLRDCYIVWPEPQVQQWALSYLEKAKSRGIVPDSYEAEDFLRDFDLMGLQRHLKVLGIFCRLYLRDGKPRYLEDLPRVMDYVLRVADKYSELQEFAQWFRACLIPLALQKLAETARETAKETPKENSKEATT